MSEYEAFDQLVLLHYKQRGPAATPLACLIFTRDPVLQATLASEVVFPGRTILKPCKTYLKMWYLRVKLIDVLAFWCALLMVGKIVCQHNIDQLRQLLFFLLTVELCVHLRR